MEGNLSSITNEDLFMYHDNNINRKLTDTKPNFSTKFGLNEGDLSFNISPLDEDDELENVQRQDGNKWIEGPDQKRQKQSAGFTPEWLKEEIRRRKIVENNKDYQFITLVAGFANVTTDRLYVIEDPFTRQRREDFIRKQQEELVKNSIKPETIERILDSTLKEIGKLQVSLNSNGTFITYAHRYYTAIDKGYKKYENDRSSRNLYNLFYIILEPDDPLDNLVNTITLNEKKVKNYLGLVVNDMSDDDLTRKFETASRQGNETFSIDIMAEIIIAIMRKHKIFVTEDTDKDDILKGLKTVDYTGFGKALIGFLLFCASKGQIEYAQTFEEFNYINISNINLLGNDFLTITENDIISFSEYAGRQDGTWIEDIIDGKYSKNLGITLKLRQSIESIRIDSLKFDELDDAKKIEYGDLFSEYKRASKQENNIVKYSGYVYCYYKRKEIQLLQKLTSKNDEMKKLKEKLVDWLEGRTKLQDIDVEPRQSRLWTELPEHSGNVPLKPILVSAIAEAYRVLKTKLKITMSNDELQKNDHTRILYAKLVAKYMIDAQQGNQNSYVPPDSIPRNVIQICNLINQFKLLIKDDVIKSTMDYSSPL